jgi:hypothetical protein
LVGKNGVQGEPTGIGDQLMVNGTPGPREGRATVRRAKGRPSRRAAGPVHVHEHDAPFIFMKMTLYEQKERYDLSIVPSFRSFVRSNYFFVALYLIK